MFNGSSRLDGRHPHADVTSGLDLDEPSPAAPAQFEPDLFIFRSRAGLYGEVRADASTADIEALALQTLPDQLLDERTQSLILAYHATALPAFFEVVEEFPVLLYVVGEHLQTTPVAAN